MILSKNKISLIEKKELKMQRKHQPRPQKKNSVYRKRVKSNSQRPVVSITDFGAKCDGALQTEKIQESIDYCFLLGGGEVVVPKGVYHSGGIRLRSGVTLHLLENAALMGSRNPEDYMGILSDKIEPMEKSQFTDKTWAGEQKEFFKVIEPICSRWNNALIRAVNASDIAIVGDKNSVIDGQDCYDKLGEAFFRGPHVFNFRNCRNVTMRGYTVKNSPNLAHLFFDSSNLIFKDITVLGGHDGLQLNYCTNTTISDCSFYTGDDCISGVANSNMFVKNCVINTACNGMRFGGTNVWVTNCHFYGPGKYLFRGSLSVEERKSNEVLPENKHHYAMLTGFNYFAHSMRETELPPGNIMITNCKFENVGRLVHYNFSGNDQWQQHTPLRNLKLENISASGISYPITLFGDPHVKLSAEFKKVRLAFRENLQNDSAMRAAYCECMLLDDVTITNMDKDCPLIKTWGENGHFEFKGLKADIPQENLVVKAVEEFHCDCL